MRRDERRYNIRHVSHRRHHQLQQQQQLPAQMTRTPATNFRESPSCGLTRGEPAGDARNLSGRHRFASAT